MRRLLLILIVLLLTTLVVFGQEGGITYTVQPGDTLARIAARYGVTAQAIADANGITNPDLIYAGQVLTIPVAAPPATFDLSATPSSGATRTSTPVQPAATQPPTSAVTLEPGAETAEAVPFSPVSFELGGEVFSFAYPELMRRAGMTWAASQIRWTMGGGAEIVQGAIDAARANNFRILLRVIGEPAEWALDPAAYNVAFAEFLGAVAALNPDAIEVWSGQNLASGWAEGRVSASAYTEMLSAAYTAIKAANPAVMVISGAPMPTPLFASCLPSGCEDSAYLQQMAAAGAGNSADCIGVQYTQGAFAPDVTSGDSRITPQHHSYYYRALLDIYASIFPDKPLCFTRIGYLTNDGLGALPAGYEWADSTSLAEQAEWLARAAIVARLEGRVQLMIVWNVDATVYRDVPQAGYALVRADGECIACIALNAATRVR